MQKSQQKKPSNSLTQNSQRQQNLRKNRRKTGLTTINPTLFDLPDTNVTNPCNLKHAHSNILKKPPAEGVPLKEPPEAKQQPSYNMAGKYRHRIINTHYVLISHSFTTELLSPKFQ